MNGSANYNGQPVFFGFQVAHFYFHFKTTFRINVTFCERSFWTFFIFPFAYICSYGKWSVLKFIDSLEIIKTTLKQLIARVGNVKLKFLRSIINRSHVLKGPFGLWNRFQTEDFFKCYAKTNHDWRKFDV